MTVEDFREEFAKFLHCFTSPFDDQAISPVIKPLGYREILGAVTDVINTKFNIDVVNLNEAEVKTPAAAIIVTTPDAPDIPKITHEHGENGDMARFKSSDALDLEHLGDSSNEAAVVLESCPSSTSDNVHPSQIDDSKAQQAENTAAPKASPSANGLVRSDTYVREDEDGNAASNEDKFDTDNVLSQFSSNPFGNFDFTLPDVGVPEVRKKLNSLREAATEVVRMIDDLEKNSGENTRPIRRLSSIGCFPSANRNSGASRTIQRPKMSRRSLTTFPGTPTSSRMSPVGGKMDSTSVKSASTASVVNIGGSKLAIPSTLRSVSSGALKVGNGANASPRLSIVKSSKFALSTHRSVSSGALKLEKKSNKSPNQTLRPSSAKIPKTPLVQSPMLSLLSLANESQSRPPKNPRYSHVQSTIPKLGPVLGKRKAEEF